MGKFKLFLPVFITVNADIALYKTNTSDVFEVEYQSLGAQFGPDVPDEGLFGILELAHPLKACQMPNKTDFEPTKVGNRTFFPILLVQRGDCQFDQKVKNGEEAGYAAVIVYDDKPNDRLIPMGSQTDPEPHIQSVFTSLESGEAIKSRILSGKPVYIKLTADGYIPYIPKNFLLPFAMAVGSCLLIMLVSTVVKLVRDWRKSRRGRLSRRKLNQLPIIKFKQEDHGDLFDCCAICLEDFKNGDKIRELPCKHGYHKSCIDPWLTSNRKVCPLCKRTVLPSSDDSEVSESEEAPLLENEVRQPNQVEETPRVVSWARAFANHMREARSEGESSGESPPRRSQSVDRMSTDSTTRRSRRRRQRRSRTISDRSYESTGELESSQETSTPVTTVATITSNASVEIRPRSRSVDYSSSTNGDDESTPSANCVDQIL